MKKSKHEIEQPGMLKIIEGFKMLEISKEQFPSYTDAESFAQTFTECSALINVPLITLGSTQRLDV